MSYRDADIYGDVVDVLDSLRDNVDAYLTAMLDDDDAPSSSSGNNGDRQPRTQQPTLSVTAPCRAYIKENGPLVMRLSESVQSVLRCVVERQRNALTSPTSESPSSRGPTPEAARSDAVRALVTRKLGEVMENAHAMRSIVKQQQQLLRSKRFAQAPRTASATTDTAASGSDLRMKQLLRVVAHDLEDTERLLRIAFPEAVRGPALSSSPVDEEPDALLPTFALSGSSYSPDRPSVNTTGIFSPSETPRHSTSTAPYVRRSESMETPRLPRQPSPSGPVVREANHSRSGGNGGGQSTNPTNTASAVSAAAGAEDDSVLHSLEASVSSSLSGRPTSPRVRFAMESDEEGGSSSADHSAHSLLRDAMEHNDLIRTGGLASNPVHLRHNSVSSSSNENNASRTHSNNASTTANGDSNSSGGSAINRAAATVGRSFNSVLGNVMQLAPFTHRRPSLTADPADSSTTGTTSHDQDDDHAGEDVSGERRSSEASGTGGSSSSAATLVAATETKAYDDALHIIASAEKPRGILKTSSSRLAAAASGVAGGRSGEGNSSNNNNNNDNSSTSRLSGASSPGASRPFVQFVDDVLPPSHPRSSSGGTGNNTTTSYNDSSVTASEVDLFCGGASAASSFSMNHSNTSIGSGRLRGLPPGLPPRSPRNPEALSASVSQPGGQRPPLAPSASASLTSFAPPARNVWVTSTHSQRLPGELWANILAAKRRVMEEVLRDDVVDLFNYGEEEIVLHRDDVTDIRFNVIDAYLYVRFELEHRRSLTESEINLRLGLCSYPLMTGLYEEYFQEYQAHEFEPIEESLSTLSNLTTPKHGGSTRLSLSSTSPSYHAEHRLASTVSLSIATPQQPSPPVKAAHTEEEEDHAPIVSPLSIATDNSSSHTASMIGDLTTSFPFTSHGSGAAALPPSIGRPPASAAAAPAATTSVPSIAASPPAATVGKAVGAGGVRRPPVALTTASLTATATAAPPPSQPQRQNHQDAQHPLSPPHPAPLSTSGTINPSTIDTPRPAAASRRNARRLPERDSTSAAGATTTSFAVAARQRDSPAATSASPSASSGSTTPSSSANATNASSSDSSSASRRAHAHTVRLPGQHWEAVTLRVPEGDLADAFVSDVGTALGVLPSEARASCQHPRFYLGSLVVKFRWSNAELYPGAAPLSAAEVDAKLADYAFPALHRIYGLSCAALHLADDLNAEERRPTAVVSVAFPSPAPVAQLVLPDKTSLDERGMDEAAVCESSTISDERDMQHRGEGAPSRSPSTSFNTPRLVNNTRAEKAAKGGARGRQSTPTRTRSTEANVVQEVEASATAAEPAAAVPEAAVPREASPDPIAATHHVAVRRDGRHPDAEAEPRVATPLPTQPSRSRSSPRHSHSPVPAARVLTSGRGGDAAKPAADAAGVKSASRSRSKDGARGATAPPRRTPSTSDTRPAHTPATTTTTTTTTLTKLARQHNTSLKALLQWNPTLAHIDPEKVIAVPASLIIPKLTPTSTPPPPPALASQPTTQSAAASGNADTTTVADTTATAQTGVSPRSLSARRQMEGGIVASLRSRPRLTPREPPSTNFTSAPALQPPPSRETPAPTPVAVAEPQRSASSIYARSPPPPPLSVADVAARRASHTSSARAAPTTAVTATTTAPPPVVAAAAPQARQLPSRSNTDAPDTLEHSALSHKSAATSHASADPAPQLERSTGSRQPASVQRLREASPRSAQAAAVAATAAAAAEPPDHLVYHLPSGATAAVDPLLLLPSDKQHTAPAATATAEHLSTARSARRTQRQPLSNPAAAAPPATATAGRGGASKESATTESESGDRESAISVLTEQEVGLRVCGLVVEGVRRRSAAADAGLQVGDTLRTLDGAPLISASDLQRGLLMRRLAGEHTAFLTAVSAQGSPVTYRLRIESAGAAVGAVEQRLPQQGGSTARKPAGSVASSASGTFSPPSLQAAAVQQRGSNAGGGGGGFTARNAVLLSPPARQAVTSQTARSFSGARRPQTATTATSNSTGTAAGILRGEAVQATPAARTRVSSIGAAMREAPPLRSHLNKVLRETAAPETVHVTTAATGGASRPLSARRTGRDQLSAARVRPAPQ